MPFVVLCILFILCACWGSFLNVLAYRLIEGSSILYGRSACPHCKAPIACYDLIPIASWFALRGRCRSCAKPISFLYPLIELISAAILTILALITPTQYFVAYFIFFSALIITIRSDLEYMLISRCVTLYLVPFAFIAALYHWLPISLYASMVGAAGGYIFLWSIAFLFKKATGKDGMGQGDFDLLALIGACTGPVGCWASLLCGSILGSCVGIGHLLIYKPSDPVKIPFGPFLALGAMAYIFMTFLGLY